MLLAVGVGVLVTLATTFTLAWGASRVSPLTAMSGGAGEKLVVRTWYERWGWVGALGLALLFWVTNTAVAKHINQGEAVALGSLTNFILFIPLLIPPFIVLLAIPTTMRGGLWLIEWAFPRAVAVRLAVSNIHNQKSRALLTTAMFVISLMLCWLRAP